MKNIFETQLSKEKQNRLIANIKHRVNSALKHYQDSRYFIFDSLANKTDVKAQKIVRQVINNMSDDFSKLQKGPELQKKVAAHFKSFAKRHLEIRSYKNIRFYWKIKKDPE